MNVPRTLPHRAQAEDAVLGAIMLRGREALDIAVAAIGDNPVEAFYQPRAQAVLRGQLILREQGLPIDVITLERQLRHTGELELVGGIEGLAKLDRFATAHNIKAHCALIREAAVHRDLVVYHRESAEQLMQGIDESAFASWASSSQTRHAMIHARAFGESGLVSIKDAALEGWRQICTRALTANGNATRFGFRRLDAAFGGMLPGELWILGARTGNGKSAFAAAVARNQVLTPAASRGRWTVSAIERPVLFSTCEQEVHELAMRWLSELAMIDSSAFRAPTKQWLEANREVLIGALKMLGKVPITLGYRPRYTLDAACADARVWVRRERDRGRSPRLTIFDYLQRFRVTGALAREPRERQVAEIADVLKDLAQELKIPVVALVQLNRGPEGREGGRPRESDLRESGNIENTADGIGLLWRPERYHPERRQRKAQLDALDELVNTPGHRLTDSERENYKELYRARLEAWIDFPKVRGGAADWCFRLEFLPEFTRFLDLIGTEESKAA